MDSINIFLEGNYKPLAVFEPFDAEKALDWLTQKGYYILKKTYAPMRCWIVRPLP